MIVSYSVSVALASSTSLANRHPPSADVATDVADSAFCRRRDRCRRLGSDAVAGGAADASAAAAGGTASATPDLSTLRETRKRAPGTEELIEASGEDARETDAWLLRADEALVDEPLERVTLLIGEALVAEVALLEVKAASSLELLALLHEPPTRASVHARPHSYMSSTNWRVVSAFMTLRLVQARRELAPCRLPEPGTRKPEGRAFRWPP